MNLSTLTLQIYDSVPYSNSVKLLSDGRLASKYYQEFELHVGNPIKRVITRPHARYACFMYSRSKGFS